MMPHLLHEARAAQMPVVMPLNIQGANGDLHCNIIHFIGSKIERFEPRGNIRDQTVAVRALYITRRRWTHT